MYIDPWITYNTNGCEFKAKSASNIKNHQMHIYKINTEGIIKKGNSKKSFKYEDTKHGDGHILVKQNKVAALGNLFDKSGNGKIVSRVLLGERNR